MNISNFDYWSYIYDSAPKVMLHITGEPVHGFFDVRGMLKWGAGLGKDSELKDQVVDMPISEYLGLAEPIPADDYKRHSTSSVQDFIREVHNGKDFGWTLPYLIIRQNEDEKWKVVGHDGRHRAKLLELIGYSKIPVHLIFETAIPKTKRSDLPKELWCQNDCGRERERYSYDFPVTKDNFGDAYFEVVDAPHPEKPHTATSPANVKDEVGIKFKALCPKANEEAKANYEKDKEPDPYKRDATVPYETFGEFLKKQHKLQIGKGERGAI